MSIIIAVYLLNFAAYVIFAEQKCVHTQKNSVELWRLNVIYI